MFRKNDSHHQPLLLSPVRLLTEKQRQRLEASWAGVFYREFFRRLDETPFAVLYSDKTSRPNIAVNVMVSLEFLKAGHGWSDEEMYDQFQYNLQVRYALGLHDFEAGNFELRTVYNFRRRLSQYQKEAEKDLLAQAWAAVTDEQLAAYGIRTEKQRMDSSQIGSDIADASRLQLVVTAIQRAARLLDESQKASYADLLAPFQEGEAEQYVYRVKGREATQTALQTGGELLAQLLAELGDAEAGEAHVSHQAVKRLFADNFCLTAEGTVRVKGNDEIRAGALQSLDDLEATFRRKGGDAYKGYVVNLAETCDPRNELQLITHVQVAPNNTDDATLLCEALPELSRRTDLTDMYSDGGFGSPEADETLLDHGVTLHQTHLRGKAPDPTRYNLADFQIACDETGQPTYLGCPGGQIVPVLSGRTTGFVARFTRTHCQTCPAFQKQCRVRQMSQRPVCQLEFTRQELLWALRRQNHLRLRQTPGDPRAAIEATVRSVKHPFGGRLPVRGLRRVTDMLLGAAAMANIRSIVRFHKRKQKQRPQPVEQGWQEAVKKDITRALGDALASFLSFLPLSSWVRQPILVTCFSC
ncbi:MAG: transposase [Chloroflexi bacterium]|nr:transposase [Chloroflexota bacterium]